MTLPTLKGRRRGSLVWYLPTEVQKEKVEQEVRSNVAALTDRYIHRAMAPVWHVPAFMYVLSRTSLKAC